MSQVIHRNSFAGTVGDERLSTYNSNVETSTLRRGPVQSVEFPHFMGDLGHGLWPNEHPSTTGPYSAMNHPNYPPQASYTSTTGYDSLPHTITQSAEHRGNQTNHDGYHVPIAPGPLQHEYYAPVAPGVPINDPLGYAPTIPGNVTGPSQNNTSPVHSGISDDEDLKRLAKRYLNNHSTHVDKLLVRRRFRGRRVLILLAIDDAGVYY